MKILKYIFRDHYKVSTDRFRDVLGLYHDFKDDGDFTLHPELSRFSIPLKGIYQHSEFVISDPVIVDEEHVVYRQNITYKPAWDEENLRYLNSLYIYRDIDTIDSNLVARRMRQDVEDYTPIDGGSNTSGGSGNGSSVDVVIVGDEDPRGVAGYVPPILQTFTPLTNRDIILQTIQDPKKYEDINTTTNKVAKGTDNFDHQYVAIKSEYNFYAPKYEDQIKADLVPEEILPNFYVVSLALNKDILNSISQDDYDSSLDIGANSPYENLYQKFDKYITLDGNLSFNRDPSMGIIFGLTLAAYMEQYADAYDSVSIDYVETVKKRFGHLFNNVTNKDILDKLNEFKGSYPMYINIEWTTTTLSPLLVFLQNAGISLQALQAFLSDKLLIEVKSVPTGLMEYARFSIVTDEPEIRGPSRLNAYKDYLYTYEAGQWIIDFLSEIFAGTSSEIVHSNELFVIDQNENQIPITNQLDPMLGQHDITPQYNSDPLHNIFEILNAISSIPGYKDLLRSSMRTYKDIINGELAKSEVLLYKIEKRNEQHKLLQTFYIPNVSGINVQNYVDTQVKWNKNYKYKIFAITAIYGTEYNYEPFRVDTVEDEENYFYNAMQGHLQISTDVNLGLSLDISETSFMCWFKVDNADEGHPLFDLFPVTTSASDGFVLSFYGTSGGIEVDHLRLNAWYHLAIVCKQANSSTGPDPVQLLYINGMYAGTVVGNKITELKDKNFIAGYSSGAGSISGDPFDISLHFPVSRNISNISIFGRGLSPTEVMAARWAGRCWDIRKTHDGSSTKGIPDWIGETPLIYWRRKAIDNFVSNEGFGGKADLYFNGDAISIKCDEVPGDGMKFNNTPAEDIPPIDDSHQGSMQPPIDVPPIVDIPPILNIMPVEHIDPGTPFIIDPIIGDNLPTIDTNIPVDPSTTPKIDPIIGDNLPTTDTNIPVDPTNIDDPVPVNLPPTPPLIKGPTPVKGGGNLADVNKTPVDSPPIFTRVPPPLITREPMVNIIHNLPPDTFATVIPEVNNSIPLNIGISGDVPIATKLKGAKAIIPPGRVVANVQGKKTFTVNTTSPSTPSVTGGKTTTKTTTTTKITPVSEVAPATPPKTTVFTKVTTPAVDASNTVIKKTATPRKVANVSPSSTSAVPVITTTTTTEVSTTTPTPTITPTPGRRTVGSGRRL